MTRVASSLFLSLLLSITCHGQLKKFKGQYDQFIGSDEKEIETGYHYLITKISDNHYIYRQFFPETKQLTDEKHFDSKKLTNLNGPYKQWYDDGSILISGYFENNLPTGFWEISQSSKSGMSKGPYEKGKKNGLWKSYDSKNRIKEEINYSDGIRSGAFIHYDSLGLVINTGTYQSDSILIQSKIDSPDSLIDGETEIMPMIAGFEYITDYQERKKMSDKALLEHLYENLKYPTIAREYEVEGRAIVQFVVDSTGAVTDIDVIRGLCASIKNATIKSVSNLPKWNPGIQRGKAVRVLYTLPVTYRLD